jgi:predicted flavoprotein YhiN
MPGLPAGSSFEWIETEFPVQRSVQYIPRQMQAGNLSCRLPLSGEIGRHGPGTDKSSGTPLVVLMEHVRETGVLVIGGGPAGLFCALNCARQGRPVVLLEKMPSCGRKLLITGSGQCNLTHEGDISGFFSRYGDHGVFLRPALLNFSNSNLVAFFESKGVSMSTLPGGKVFPSSMKASDILRVLLGECSRSGVDLHCGEPVQEVTRKGEKFIVRTIHPGPGAEGDRKFSGNVHSSPGSDFLRDRKSRDDPVNPGGQDPGVFTGQLSGRKKDPGLPFIAGADEENFRYSADILVIATGGASYPGTGSSGDGFRIMKALGQPVTEIGPALVPVVVAHFPFADMAGMSFEGVKISIFRSGRKVREGTGDLLFTHEGLSGPGILDLSRYIRPGDSLQVSFLPGRDRPVVQDMLLGALGKDGSRQVKTILRDLPLPERLARRLAEIAGIPADRTAAHITKKERNNLIFLISEFRFEVLSLAGFGQAMVTRGGADLDAVDPKTMRSRVIPGLYIIGEALDIDGDTGGFNLQAAFSTAALAAADITKRLD